MSLGKKTIQRVSSILKDEKKRKLYTPEEITYMEKQLVLLKQRRKERLEQRKRQRGFS